MGNPQPDTSEAETERASGPSVQLPAVLDVAGAAALHASLAAKLRAAYVVLDGGGVARVDAAGLQLLCAFRQSAELAGVSCGWNGISDVLREAAQNAGLEAHLALP